MCGNQVAIGVMNHTDGPFLRHLHEMLQLAGASVEAVEHTIFAQAVYPFPARRQRAGQKVPTNPLARLETLNNLQMAKTDGALMHGRNAIPAALAKYLCYTKLPSRPALCNNNHYQQRQ
jgi:hypothetical protein